MIGVQWDLKLRSDWGLFLGLVPGTDMIERKNERTKERTSSYTVTNAGGGIMFSRVFMEEKNFA
jgi:hypothetical protein